MMLASVLVSASTPSHLVVLGCAALRAVNRRASGRFLRRTLSMATPIVKLASLLLLLTVSSPVHAGSIGGNNTIGTTNYPQGGMRRVNKLTMSSNQYQGLYTAVYDGNRYAYFSGRSHWLIKVDVSGPAPVEVGAVQCSTGGVSAVIDAAAGYLWYGGEKVKLDDGTGNMLCLGGPTTGGVAVIDLSDIDPSKHYILATGPNATIYKIAPGAGDNPSTVMGSITLNPGETARRALLDARDPSPANHAALFASAGSGPGTGAVFVKVAYGAANNPVRIGATVPDPGDKYNIGGVGIDTANGFAYFATYDCGGSSSRVIQVALGGTGQPPTRVGHVQLASGERLVSVGVIDATAGFAWFSNDLMYPASVYKIDLHTFTETSDLVLQGGTQTPPPDCVNAFNNPETLYGEVFMQSSVIDPVRGYAYFGTDSVKGQVVKVALSEKSAVKAIRIALGGASAISDINFYAHTAAGNVRLGIYDDSPSKALVWQSAPMATVAGWMNVPIASGVPSSLNLPGGTYWLAWQVDSNDNVPSYSSGTAGDGWMIEQPAFGLPASAGATTSTDESWSIYIDYVSASAPVADFVGSPLVGQAPLSVAFTDLSTNGPTSWSWSFGDGGTSSLANPSHVYVSAGSYTVSLTVGNGSGSDTATKPGYVTVQSTGPIANYLSGKGRWQGNDNGVRIQTLGGALRASWNAYGAGQWGTLVAAADIDASGRANALTGPGPGAVYGPQVRAFREDGTGIAKVNFYAYGTLRYGVNVAGGSLDADAPAEIVSGAGPGAVFGPHVRGFNYDGVSLSPLAKVSFFAYQTLRYGVGVACADIDGDGFAEILTGPGPSSVFGPQVRGFNVDGGGASAIGKVNFLAFASATHGVNLAGGDVDADAFDEILVGRGPGPTQACQAIGFDYDGAQIAPLGGFDVTPLSGAYGARPAAGDVDGDGAAELVVSQGEGAASVGSLRTYRYSAGALAIVGAGSFDPFPASVGCNPSLGVFGY